MWKLSQIFFIAIKFIIKWILFIDLVRPNWCKFRTKLKLQIYFRIRIWIRFITCETTRFDISRTAWEKKTKTKLYSYFDHIRQRWKNGNKLIIDDSAITENVYFFFLSPKSIYNLCEILVNSYTLQIVKIHYAIKVYFNLNEW